MRWSPSGSFEDLCGTTTRCRGSSIVDKNPDYPRAVTELKAGRWNNQPNVLSTPMQVFNNVVEQDHRNVKRRTWLASCHGSLPTAWRILRGIEVMEMVRQGRAEWVTKGNLVGQVKFISRLFGETITETL
jgi:transposase, IS6 family